MNKPLLIAAALTLSSFTQAAPDPAYVRQQVAETVQGASQNSNFFSKEEMQTIANNAYSNSEQFKNDARQVHQSTSDYLKTNEARKNQQEMRQMNQELHNRKELPQIKRDGYSMCLNAQNYGDIECNTP